MWQYVCRHDDKLLNINMFCVTTTSDASLGILRIWLNHETIRWHKGWSVSHVHTGRLCRVSGEILYKSDKILIHAKVIKPGNQISWFLYIFAFLLIPSQLCKQNDCNEFDLFDSSQKWYIWQEGPSNELRMQKLKHEQKLIADQTFFGANFSMQVLLAECDIICLVACPIDKSGSLLTNRAFLLRLVHFPNHRNSRYVLCTVEAKLGIFGGVCLQLWIFDNDESGISYWRKFTIHAIYKRIHTICIVHIGVGCWLL